MEFVNPKQLKKTDWQERKQIVRISDRVKGLKKLSSFLGKGNKESLKRNYVGIC